jgi:Putative zinc-finger
MSHVDEGTLHALLDGELAPAEVLEVQTHFATCPACSSRLDDARRLLAETERLVTALEAAVPLGGETATARTARPVAAPPPPRRPVEPPARPAATPPLPAASPETLVLIPNNPTATEIRRSRLKVMGWAAAFLVVIGAGVLGVQMRNGFFDKKPAGTLKIRPEEFSTPGGSDLPPPTPAAKPQGALGLSIPESTVDQARNAPPAAAPAAQAPPVAKPAQPAGAAASGPALATKPAQAPASGIFPSAEDRQAIVDRAAKATEELDRERSRERAAAATAALDAQRKQAAARQAAAQANPTPAPTPAPPPVPTIDQRSRIANRIGLDEAARQLGGPLHAIDGMSRQLVGVVSPQLVPGSDTSRGVVRAVYVDRAGRLIFLDQQRVRPGQTNLPFTPLAERNGELRWMAGQVMLVLQGDLPTDSLRLLYRRVR